MTRSGELAPIFRAVPDYFDALGISSVLCVETEMGRTTKFVCAYTNIRKPAIYKLCCSTSMESAADRACSEISYLPIFTFAIMACISAMVGSPMALRVESDTASGSVGNITNFPVVLDRSN